MPSSLSILLKRWVSQRHFYAGVGIPCFAAFILVIGGFKNILILLHEARTMATITEMHPRHRGGPSIYYRYVVEGHTYTGRGAPDHKTFSPPYSVGDTFEIRYSKTLPFFSTAENPVTIFGQFAVGSLFLLWVDYIATRYGKRGERKPGSVPAPN